MINLSITGYQLKINTIDNSTKFRFYKQSSEVMSTQLCRVIKITVNVQFTYSIRRFRPVFQADLTSLYCPELQMYTAVQNIAK